MVSNLINFLLEQNIVTLNWIPKKKMLHNIFYFNFIQFNKFFFLLYTIWVFSWKPLSALYELFKQTFFFLSIYTCFITNLLQGQSKGIYLSNQSDFSILVSYNHRLQKKKRKKYPRQYAITIFFFLFIYL